MGAHQETFRRLLSRLNILKNLPIRYRILLACIAMFAPFSVLAGNFANSMMRDFMETQIDREMSNATKTMISMIQISKQATIRNTLSTVSKTNASIVEIFYREFLLGNMTETQAKSQAAQILVNQSFADNGYVFCLDSTGTILVHPLEDLVGTRLAGVSYVDSLVQKKSGFSEFNLYDSEAMRMRVRVSWSSYFEPWDWIISASVNRDELDQLINVDDFSQSIEAFKFMNEGFSYVVDLNGYLIAHPEYRGRNVYSQGVEMPEGLFGSMLSQERGSILFSWLNPAEMTTRKKIVVFEHLNDLGWIVASTAYIDDLYSPINKMQNIGMLAGLFSLFGGVLITFYISSSITEPLRVMVKHFGRGSTGDYSVRMLYDNNDEIGQLSRYFNRFIGQIGDEIRERERLEQQLIEAEDNERLKIGQDLHDDLAPHLIGIEVMCQVLSNKLRAEGPEYAQQIDKIRALIAESIVKTRAMARGLCPIHNISEGLGAALRELVEVISDIHSVQCVLHSTEKVNLKGAVAVHLYRITQEAISNAVKHSGASRIAVVLADEDDDFILEIRDNGKGFAVSTVAAGMGLQIMKFRSQLFGGKLAIESSHGCGTVVRLQLNKSKIPVEEVSDATSKI